jgi:glycosyltransferase involved in cell wall biosynthesis
MDIGIDASRAVRPERTGTENYSFHLIRALLDLDTPHHFRLYFNQPPPPDLLLSTPNASWKVMPFPRLWTHLRLSIEMLMHPPDVLFVPAHVLPLVHPPSVATVHDLGYRYFPEAHTWGARLYLEWGTRYNARASRLVVADSRCTQDDLVRMYGMAKGKIRVAYPGIRPGLTRVEDASAIEAVLHRYGIPRPYVLTVGTLQPRKNLSRLIEAFAGVPEPHVLVLAGKKGWLCADILRRAESLGLERRVVFPGYVGDKDLAALLSGADLFAFPSLYEGFGLPVLEAMACGTPVVCSNAGSLPEVAGDAALIVPPTDMKALTAAMLRALTDTILRQAMVQHGFEQAATFTWQHCAERVLAALEEAAT